MIDSLIRLIETIRAAVYEGFITGDEAQALIATLGEQDDLIR